MTNFSKMAILGLACISVFACKKDENGKPVDETIKAFEPKEVILSEKNFLGETGSANGKYIAGTSYETWNAAIWDVEAGKIVDIANFPGSLHAVNNSGLAVGEGEYAIMVQGATGSVLYHDESMKTIMYEDWMTGEKTPMEVPAESGSSAYAVSENNVIAGFFYDSAYNTLPCLWKAPYTTKESRVNLPVPTEAEVGFPVNGAEVRWISADAKVVLGYLIDDMATNPACIWEQQSDGSYKAKPICVAYFHPEGANGAQYMHFEPIGFSSNGEWVSLIVAKPYDFMNWEPEVSQSARLNLKTNVIEVLPSDTFFHGFGISNDGTVAGATSGMVMSRDSYVWKSGDKSASALPSVVANATGLNGLENIAVGYIAPDNSYACGFANNENFDTITFIVK